ncbi:metal-dependent amidase/aminoacylase/carboxypeptidase [Triangularia verruculosa]|uniref:Metal-dependent amidase/aminoacylase/carboxypeptidase n=1 Tax=Triangularia verruculosa TaxID=2587418 RepID=A0AAN6XAG5_9PEZI|nr:metal-dependent amidase/aminoacylase/carboxypeptidase [Triangularia verruculosa]
MSDSAMENSPSFLVSSFRPDLAPYEDLYRKLHRHPDLSKHEAATASTVANVLRSLADVDVTTDIGGHGLVGILRNGQGPTVMLRAELDALPMLEQTNLPYAATVHAQDPQDGPSQPAMHACGHDMHMAGLLASAELLHRARERWSGTVVFLFQPDEENGAGAQCMVDDGLYDPRKHAVPHPDIVLGGHVMPMRAGTIATRRGAFNSTSESLRVTFYGHGGHGAKPHKAVDPVLMACSAVLKLQTIVSRETDPQQMAVVTVGSIHAGNAPNVIPEEATLLINTRSFSTSLQESVRDSIRRIVFAESEAFRAPKPPSIERITFFPLLYNDPSATDTLEKSMRHHFGGSFLPEIPASTGSEDISNLAAPSSAPVSFWNYGGICPNEWDGALEQGATERILANHNPKFAPVIQPTLTVATDAYALAALTFLTIRCF